MVLCKKLPREQHSANTLVSIVDTPWCSDLTQHIAPHESLFRQTDDRSWKLDNLQLLVTLPGRNSCMLDASCHFYVSDCWCRVESSVCNFPSRVGRDTNSFGVALLAVILELPDGMPICHAGTNNNLELRSVQKLSAECLWQGSLRLEVE